MASEIGAANCGEEVPLNGGNSRKTLTTHFYILIKEQIMNTRYVLT